MDDGSEAGGIVETVKRLDAPSGRFAELLRRCEELLADDSITRVSFVGNDHLRDMAKCIREQQAALAALCDVANNAQCLHELEQARAVLAKWRLE